MHVFWQGRYLDDGNGRVRRHERPGHPPFSLTQVHPSACSRSAAAVTE